MFIWLKKNHEVNSSKGVFMPGQMCMIDFPSPVRFLNHKCFLFTFVSNFTEFQNMMKRYISELTFTLSFTVMNQSKKHLFIEAVQQSSTTDSSCFCRPYSPL